jgi:hypothetical protein
MRIKQLTPNDVTITVTAEPEQMPVRGNAIVSDDPKKDKRVEDRIIRRLDNGDIWAWCSVEIKCEYEGLTAEDYLGGCSYKNERDFIKHSGYYNDMVRTCIMDLQKQLEELVNKSITN